MKILTGIPLQQTTYTSSITLGLNNAGKLLLMNGASTNSVTVPPNASVNFAIGTKIIVVQTSAIQVTFVAGAGVTINSENNILNIANQYANAVLIKTDTNTWSLLHEADLTNLNASNLTSGTVPTARLGTGTADSTTYLRGDNTWQTISGTSIYSADGTLSSSRVVSLSSYNISFNGTSNKGFSFTNSGGDISLVTHDNSTKGQPTQIVSASTPYLGVSGITAGAGRIGIRGAVANESYLIELSGSTSWVCHPTSGSYFYQFGFGYTGRQKDGKWIFGTNDTPLATLHSKGSGTTSATVNFLLQNSVGTQCFKVQDNNSIGFYSATPVVQATTSGTAGTLVSNGGTTLTSTDTIDGYTLQQVVKALRNLGILA